MSRRPLSPPTSAQPEPVSPGGRGVHPAARRGTAIFTLAAPPFPSSMQSGEAPQITVTSRRQRHQPGACCLSAAGCCVDAAATFQPLPSRKEAGVTLIGGGHDRCCWEEKHTDFYYSICKAGGWSGTCNEPHPFKKKKKKIFLTF